MLAQLPRDRSLGGVGVGGRGRTLSNPRGEGSGLLTAADPPHPRLKEGCCPSQDLLCALVTGPWVAGDMEGKARRQRAAGAARLAQPDEIGDAQFNGNFR